MTPKEKAEKMESLMSDITSKMMKQSDEKLWSFFKPYLREAGIKGEITKGKIKWRGIKLKVQNDLSSSKYQLNQRGVDISPVFTVEFGLLDALKITMEATKQAEQYYNDNFGGQ